MGGLEDVGSYHARCGEGGHQLSPRPAVLPSALDKVSVVFQVIIILIHASAAECMGGRAYKRFGINPAEVTVVVV